MKKQQFTSFYLEALLLIVVFVAMILVLTGVFGAARVQSTRARQLSQAVTLAANAAEAVSASDDLAKTAELLDQGGNVRMKDGLLEADYLLSGAPSPNGPGALHLTVKTAPSADDPLLESAKIEVYVTGEEVPLYTLETSFFRKEAGT